MNRNIDRISTEGYEADGFIGRVRLVPEDRISDYRTQLEEFIRHHGDDRRFGDWCYFKSNIILPWVVDLAMEPGVVDAVTRILGPDVLLWNSFIPIKRPRSEGHFAWHQDATYWHLSPVEEMVTVWLAISDVSPENGCMYFLPRSHLMGQLPHEMTKGTKSMLRRGQRVLESIDDGDAAACSLRPGEASIHHPFMLHCSAGNRSNQWRLGVALNYVSARVAPKPGYRESALYVAGSDWNKTFERDPIPSGELTEESLLAMDRAVSMAAARYSDV